MKRSLPEGTLELFEVAGPLSIGAGGLLVRIYKDAGWPVVVLVVALISQGAITYLSKAKNKGDTSESEKAIQSARDEAEKVRANAEQELRLRKMDFAGNLSQLLKMCVVKDRNQLRLVQTGFLRHAVDIVKRHLGLDESDPRISATWVVRDSVKDTFRTVVYDRPQPHRSPGTTRPIKSGYPGASQAFLTGSVCYITDTWAGNVQRFFPKLPSYRTILSVPAAVLSIPTGSGCIPVSVEGVLSVDCSEIGLLLEDHAVLVHDIAYLMALCERVMAKRGKK